MSTVVLILDAHPNTLALTEAMLKTEEVSSVFFYGEGVRHFSNPLWIKLAHANHLNLSCCRSSLLRRQLIKEDQNLSSPWKLSSLTEFYQALSEAKSFSLIHDTQVQSQKKQIIPNVSNRLLIILNEFTAPYPEEWAEFIIAGTLHFEVHVFYKQQPQTEAWIKPFSALKHYEVQLETQLHPEKFNYILEF